MLGRLSLGICILVIAASTGSVYSQEFANSFITDRHLYEGDIDLTPEQRARMEAASNLNDLDFTKRAVERYTRSLWKNSRVPYRFDGSLGARAKQAINEAIADYHDQTCMRFVPKTYESDYVEFYRGTGCHSNIGRIGGHQRISIGRGCEYKGVVIHEIFHSLGRWHEQSRPDRDQYVKINRNNIRSGVEYNFELKSQFSVTTQGVPYDYSSIMHYGAYDFSRNGDPTIEPLDRSFPLYRLGQRERLSARDLQHINALYCKSASDKALASWSSWGSWYACTQSCNGGLRSRVRSCTGGSSCQGSNIDSERCNTEPCAVPVEWGSWTSWSACSVTCGGGRQSRLRRCLHGNTCRGQHVQFRDCQTHDCLERIRHIDCYYLPEFNGTLQFLEGLVEEVSDIPSARQQPVEKCSRAAEKLGYSMFAVSDNYCISGSNAVPDYQTVRAGFCSDGVGGHNHGDFAMDVYWIADPETF